MYRPLFSLRAWLPQNALKRSTPLDELAVAARYGAVSWPTALHHLLDPNRLVRMPNANRDL